MASAENRYALEIALVPALGGLLFGYDTAVISGTLEQVKKQFALSVSYEGWFVSSGLLGCIIGVLVAGLLAERAGRKKILILSGIIFFLSSCGCALAVNKEWLIFSRLCGGIGVGIASVLAPMYIAEFSPAKSRGKLVALYQLAITIGIFLAYIMNAWILSASKNYNDNDFMGGFFGQENWRGMFLVMAIPSLLFTVSLFFIPESFRYLIGKGEKQKARKILWQSRSIADAENEWAQLEKPQTTKTNINWKSIRLPLLIGILLAVFQQFSGINAIIYYGPAIFKKAGIASDNALLFQSVIGAVNIIFTFVAIRKADKSGRRSLLIYGLTGMVLSLIIIAALFAADTKAGIALLIPMLIYIGCFAMSLGPVTWIIINEIFPAAFRVKGTAICTLAVWISVGIVGQFFPLLLQKIGTASVLSLFACFCIANLIFIWRKVPETKGRILENMDILFKGH